MREQDNYDITTLLQRPRPTAYLEDLSRMVQANNVDLMMTLGLLDIFSHVSLCCSGVLVLVSFSTTFQTAYISHRIYAGNTALQFPLKYFFFLVEIIQRSSVDHLGSEIDSNCPPPNDHPQNRNHHTSRLLARSLGNIPMSIYNWPILILMFLKVYYTGFGFGKGISHAQVIL